MALTTPILETMAGVTPTLSNPVVVKRSFNVTFDMASNVKLIPTSLLSSPPSLPPTKRKARSPSSDHDDHFLRLITASAPHSPMEKGPSNNLPPITSNASQLHRISNKDATASATDNPIAPDLLPFAEIDEHRFSIISAAIKNVYGITTPWDFQIEAINYCATNDNVFLILIGRLSDGKSIVPLTVALLQNGVQSC